jgi:hypothetical protein
MVRNPSPSSGESSELRRVVITRPTKAGPAGDARLSLGDREPPRRPSARRAARPAPRPARQSASSPSSRRLGMRGCQPPGTGLITALGWELVTFDGHRAAGAAADVSLGGAGSHGLHRAATAPVIVCPHGLAGPPVPITPFSPRATSGKPARRAPCRRRSKFAPSSPCSQGSTSSRPRKRPLSAVSFQRRNTRQTSRRSSFGCPRLFRTFAFRPQRALSALPTLIRIAIASACARPLGSC